MINVFRIDFGKPAELLRSSETRSETQLVFTGRQLNNSSYLFSFLPKEIRLHLKRLAFLDTRVFFRAISPEKVILNWKWKDELPE